jgi:hypothetical protein
MPERAKVTSLEAIEDFRAKLILYREKAGRVLDEVSDDVIRTRVWLESDRQTHWQNTIRRLTRELEQRQQELFSAELSGLLEASVLQRAAVQKARHAIRSAEEKLSLVRQWQRQFDPRVEPAARQVEKLRHNLGHDLGLAVAWLNEMTKTLSAYLELSPDQTPALPPAAGENRTALSDASGVPEKAPPP